MTEKNYKEIDIYGMKLRLVPVEDVKIADTNIRGFREVEVIKRLQESIEALEEFGIETPILFPPLANNDNEIFEGGYRLEAMKSAGKTVIPIRILDIPKDEQVIISLSGGIQHPISGIDEARAVKKLQEMDDEKWTQRAIGKAIGKSEMQVSLAVGLNRIKPEIKETMEKYAVKPISSHVQNTIAKIDDSLRLKPEASLTKDEIKKGVISKETLVKIGSGTTVGRIDDISKRVNSGIPVDWNKEKQFINEKNNYDHVEIDVRKDWYATYRQHCINHNIDMEGLLTSAANYYVMNYPAILAASNKLASIPTIVKPLPPAGKIIK